MTDALKRLKDPKTYDDATLRCDVVMKGGITSGIAYPLAVCEIAAKYKLVNVGGSSAGAIAAAAAAAAEVGRDSGTGGFARLARMPGRLAGQPGAKHSMLFELFQPQPAMRRYYRLLVAFVASNLSKTARLLRAAKEAFAGFWLGAVVGSLPGLVAAAFLIVLDVRSREVRGDALSVLGILLGLLAALALAVAGGAAGMLLQAVRAGMRDFAANMFGVASGYLESGSGDPASCREDEQLSSRGKWTTKPLTTWLADEIDRLAGRDPDGDPLTFGDLCDQDVRLKMFTTNLTNGTPHTIPFRDLTEPLYFDEEEMRRLFPERVVKWMVEKKTPVSPETRAILDKWSMTLYRLPQQDDLPVIVGTRMSLSFPLLLTAVPLWQIDRKAGEPYQCWFSDGGITSNFPVHFFDAPIPRRPTFGLNLGPYLVGETPNESNQCANLYWPKRNEAALRPRWTRIDTVGGFGRALADTMQNWSDNAQSLLPGYRDRIMLIKHSEDEGGMNLDMPADRILRFAERGRCAGAKLVEKFSNPQPPDGDRLGWDNHRWIRYRSTMNVLETFIESWLRGYASPPAPSEETFPDLMAEPPSYEWNDVQRTRGERLTALLDAVAREWVAVEAEVPADPCRRPADAPDPDQYDPGHPFRKGAPRPRPRLRVTPDF